MGRKSSGRMINVSISLSAKVGSLSPESLALFCLLIPHFNAHGKMQANPHLVKGLVCPLVDWLTPEKIETCLREISDKTNVKFWQDEKGIHYLQSLNWVEHQTLKNDRLGPDHLPSWSKFIHANPGVVPELSGVVQDLSHKGKGRLREEEVEVEGKACPGLLLRLKKLHLDTCGLSSLPPMKIFEEILASGKPVSLIDDVYQLHGGDIPKWRQRNIVEALQKIRDGQELDWDYICGEGTAT